MLKRVCGMPDYQGYLAHMREKHGGCTVLSEREYFEQHMQVRYGSGVSRCC
ncbi:MAG TPA: YbdD/YjiX family protein [Gemmatimonadales bacterium]|nr:YbdD/YjiX family protein [Gemmatimonadales bacterium]